MKRTFDARSSTPDVHGLRQARRAGEADAGGAAARSGGGRRGARHARAPAAGWSRSRRPPAARSLKIEIDPKAIDPSDPELLADLVTAAVNQALRDGRALIESKMSSVLPGGLESLGLGNLPGMYGRPTDEFAPSRPSNRMNMVSDPDTFGRAAAARPRARRRRGGLRPARRGAPRAAPRPLLPDARLAPRRRGRAPGHAAPRLAQALRVRRPELARHVALPDRDERLPGHDRPAAAAHACARPRPGDHADVRHRAAARRVGLGRAVPRRRARRSRRLRRAGCPLRAARSGRARLHRRAPAPSGDAARGSDPPRGARLLGPGGGGFARHHRRLGEQRAAARPPDARRPAARAAASRRRCARSATSASACSSRPSSTRGRAATSKRCGRCSRRTPSSRCRRGRSGGTGAETLAALRGRLASASAPNRGRSSARANGQPADRVLQARRGDGPLHGRPRSTC